MSRSASFNEPAGHGRTAAAEYAGAERVGVGHQALGLERGENRGTETFSELTYLGLGGAGAVPDDEHGALAVADQLCCPGQSGFVGAYPAVGQPPVRVGRGRLAGLHLDLVGQDEVGYAAGVHRVLDRQGGQQGADASARSSSASSADHRTESNSHLQRGHREPARADGSRSPWLRATAARDPMWTVTDVSMAVAHITRSSMLDFEHIAGPFPPCVRC